MCNASLLLAQQKSQCMPPLLLFCIVLCVKTEMLEPVCVHMCVFVV